MSVRRKEIISLYEVQYEPFLRYATLRNSSQVNKNVIENWLKTRANKLASMERGSCTSIYSNLAFSNLKLSFLVNHGDRHEI